MITRKHKPDPAPEKVFSLRVKWFNLTMSYKLAVWVMFLLLGILAVCQVSFSTTWFSCSKTSAIEQIKR